MFEISFIFFITTLKITTNITQYHIISFFFQIIYSSLNILSLLPFSLLNINLDLTPFNWINPCGLKGVSVTSIAQELGENNINIISAKLIMKKHIKDVFGISLQDDIPNTFMNKKI